MLVSFFLFLLLGFRHVCCDFLSWFCKFILNLLQAINVFRFTLLNCVVQNWQSVTFWCKLNALKIFLIFRLLEFKLAWRLISVLSKINVWTLLLLLSNRFLNQTINFDYCQSHIVPKLWIPFQWIWNFFKTSEGLFKFINSATIFVKTYTHIKQNLNGVLGCSITNMFMWIRVNRLIEILTPRWNKCLLIVLLHCVGIWWAWLGYLKKFNGFAKIQGSHFKFAEPQMKDP